MGGDQRHATLSAALNVGIPSSCSLDASEPLADRLLLRLTETPPSDPPASIQVGGIQSTILEVFLFAVYGKKCFFRPHLISFLQYCVRPLEKWQVAEKVHHLA